MRGGRQHAVRGVRPAGRRRCRPLRGRRRQARRHRAGRRGRRGRVRPRGAAPHEEAQQGHPGGPLPLPGLEPCRSFATRAGTAPRRSTSTPTTCWRRWPTTSWTTAILGARCGGCCSRARASPRAGGCPACRTSSSSCAAPAARTLAALRSRLQPGRHQEEARGRRQDRARRASKQRMPREAQERSRTRAEARRRCRRDPAGQLRELQNYDFIDPEAKRKFEELLNSLRQQMMQPSCSGHAAGDAEHDAARTSRRMREMMQDLNRMLREKAEGEEPDFEAFKEKWGQRFPGVESLDQLIEQMGRQMAADAVAHAEHVARAAPAARGDDALAHAPGRAAGGADAPAGHEPRASSCRSTRCAQRYPSTAIDEVTLQEAMQLMEELQQMDELERQIRGVRDPEDLEKRRSRRASSSCWATRRPRICERLQEMTKMLEEAGYLEREGDRARADRAGHPQDRREGAARHLRRTSSAIASAATPSSAAARAATAPTTPSAYEFGDPFLLDLQETLMNAVERTGAGHAGAPGPERLRGLPHRAAAPRRPPSSCST